MNVVILAAGMGKRMRSKLPKVLQPLAGKPMLDHVLQAVQSIEPDRTIVVVGHGAQQVQDHLKHHEHLRFAVQAEQLGTGHAVKCALSELDPNSPRTIVCFGDVPLLGTNTLRALSHTGSDDELFIVTVSMDDPTGYGRIVRNEQGEIIGIVEQKDASPEQLAIQEINTGIMCFPTHRLEGWLSKLKNSNAQNEYYLTDLIELARQDGVKITSVSPEHLYEVEGVNSKVQLARLERIYQRAQAEQLLEQGVTVLDPNRIDIRGSLQCGQDVQIDVGVIFEGDCVLGDGVKVGAYCVLKDAHIEANTVLMSYTHIDQAQVGEDCRIGPFARLRPQAQLAGHNHIGNFVEIKKSQIGLGSKVNHLTYLGDSIVGSKVNVGAGVITCNYDGANKWQTVIGDDAFIGSGVQLVAPISIGKGATIGAGGAIRKSVNDHCLAVVRTNTIVREDWQRPTKKTDK